MGILNQKIRIVDTFITPEGRAQLAKGALKASFYSFTDMGAIYTEDTIVSGGLDATYRFVLEAGGLPQDQIAFEADDSGRLIGFPVSGSERFAIKAGQIFSGSKENQRFQVTGSEFSSLSETLLSGSIDAFKNQYILMSPDPIDEKDKQFLVGPKELTFHITQDMPFKKSQISNARIDHIESFFQDKRLSHIPNFKFLPPVNKSRIGTEERTLLGDYANLNQTPIQGLEDLEKELAGFESTVVNFLETSRENNLFCQFFERSEHVLKKLDVIDFGQFNVPEGGTKHVFFVGKVFIDQFDQPTFVNILTLVFE